ncbi:XRE family transcriptional regulator [Scytonema hofmannii PCC 7110]|uniref:XRE family transcriptional regulator n=2 Tax=Scytonema hofmannii TaxID=34078 RepID=A0A139XD14_9CYAN|nr:XRE family transcriptional regulator [Scytonema hofmannii PCC 7110]
MALRLSLDLTRAQIADAVGVGEEKVAEWENGSNIPRLTLGQTVRLCKITKRTVEDLADLFKQS